ncbi:hypothetical protein SAMN05444483_1029 [Salegentibacter echinorum]|uniref:Outer membrane protein beta-barrel domain-containing protein n=1 Tax=Salegentibacter echinorum TaxID=1073325 RepID=A0A1M5DKX5_SALEC|nr:hypothetical protein [Salegentibacter echinorum]SHF67659.1 hypothetical protein SAMN05444483_1029 [Salegentibacter echinorum]
MKERKNIDRLFQEKFRDFTPEPREEVWQNIAQKLNDKEDKKAFLIPLWAKVGGVAAFLALMLSGYFFTQNNTTQTQVVFEIEETAKPRINFPTLKKNSSFTQASEILKKLEQSSNASILNNQLSRPNTAIAAEDNADKTSSENSKNSDKIFASEVNENNNAIAEESKQNDSKTTSGSKKPSEEASKFDNSAYKNNAEAIATEDSEEDKSATEEENLPANIPNALAELEKEKSLKDEEERIAEASSKKMRISTFAAPVFYDNMGSGNAIDPEFAGNSTKSEVSMAYGMNLAYAISDKIKIRSGISKVAMSYNTEDILFSPGVVASDIKSINYDNKSTHYQVNNAENALPNSPNLDNAVEFSPTSRSLPGEINQRFGFIEVPLEIEYSLLDKKIGLNIIAGGSSLFLDENSVQVNANNQKTRLGEANNLNKVSFSTNIGVGLDYKLTDSFLLNLEPIFKYQLNTFSNTEGVHPFYFGIYSGVSFRF